jgi:Xaa-Pro dipeptidase
MSDLPFAATVPVAPAAPDAELADRIARFRAAMAHERVDIFVFTSRANFEYVTGHQTLTWAYQARPLFAILTQDQFFVVSSRAEARNIALKQRLFENRHYDGLHAQAAAAVVALIVDIDPTGRATVGIDYGQDILGRGSLELIDGLRTRSAHARVVAGEKIVWTVRMVKTPFEAALKRQSFAIVDEAFDASIAAARAGVSERQLQRALQARIILGGAEWADPIAMVFGRGDFVYSRMPSDRQLAEGDYLWTDFRSTFGGYAADRNRIARCGNPASWEVECYATVRSLTLELCRSIRPGQTGRDIYRTFERLWETAALGPVYGAASRIGHGGGREVTEPPSIAPWSQELIEAGMILHLEPKLERDGAVFQFEEIVQVGAAGVEFLSALSPAACPIVPI